MKPASALAALLLLAGYASAARVQTNPLGKVLTLIDDLVAKITKEGEAEAKAFKEFVEWCDDASKNSGFRIKTAESQKAKLEATIAKSSDDATVASSKIEELAGSISTDEKDLKAATTIREEESADFKANEAELMDVISKLGRAISILEREMAKKPAAFAQVDTSSVDGLIKGLSSVVDAASFSNADKSRLSALLQAEQGSSNDDEDLGAPAPAAYKTHSTNILDVLEDLKEKAEDQLASLRKAESAAAHNFAMLKQSLEDQIKADNKDLSEEKSELATAQETKASAEGDLAKCVQDLADSKTALETANGDCMQTAADHDATVKAREEELKVLAEAKKILKESTDGAVSQTYSLLQFASQTGSQLQTAADLANAEVVAMVKKLAREHHSAALAQLASRMAAVIKYGASAGEDPFAKIKGMISDMISKLEAEAGSEATEKSYCDEQMAETEAKKSELDFDIQKLTAKIDKAASSSAALKEDVKELQAELAALAKQQAEMDKIRQETHAAYSQAKEDLEQGLMGVRNALGLLREYYSSGASMLQADSDGEQPAQPVMHSKAAGAGGGIIGILEVCESDFAKNLAEEETTEADAQAAYEKMTQENKVSKTLKEQDVTYKTQNFKSLDKDISELSTDRESSSTELSAVMDYYAKIKDRCIAKPETYEERKRRREAETAGLKEALSILESETASFVQKRLRGAHHLA